MAQDGRHFVRYTFFKVDPAWRRLEERERQAQKQELAAVVGEFEGRLALRSYSTAGTRGDCDFMLWAISPALEPLQELAAQMNRCRMAGWLSTPYSYLAMTRRSQYIQGHHHAGQEGTGRGMQPLDRRYLFVYPFVKTHDWYQLPLAERQRMMEEHFKIGHRYPNVKIHTTYSFGLDDQEFVLGFEADSPSEFLDLVMELRESAARPYTERDVPIFTCVRQPLAQCLDALG